MKRKFIALATALIILCSSTVHAFAATSPSETITFEEYYTAIQDYFASYGIVWEGDTTNPHPDYVYTTEDLDIALAQAHTYCEKIIATSTVSNPTPSTTPVDIDNNLLPRSVMYHTYSMKKSNRIFDLDLVIIPTEITIETSTDILTELLTYAIISFTEPSLRVTAATGYDDYIRLISYTHSVTKNNTSNATLTLNITCEVKESITVGVVESWAYVEKSYSVSFSPLKDLD